MSAPAALDQYDVIWRTPSSDAAGSMPIGNGEVVLNAWVEAATGDLLFYVGRTDSLSEISRILKLGRVRVSFDPPVLKGDDFRHRLHLRQGYMEIASEQAALELFVDSDADVVHLSGTATEPIRVTATVENWRTEARTLPKEEDKSAWSVHSAPFPLVESADVFVNTDEASVTWYHRNETSVVPKLWENQSLTGLAGTFDPLLHRTFGGKLEGEGFYQGHPSQICAPVARKFDLKLATASLQAKTVGDWEAAVSREMKRSDVNAARKRTRQWWERYWDRSWVFVEGDLADFKIPQNRHELRKGVDSQGGNAFPGEIQDWRYVPAQGFEGFALYARIKPEELKPGRIFDKLTAGQNDGFLFDTHPGNGLRLIVGDMTLTAPAVLKADEWQDVQAHYREDTGEAGIYLNGRLVAHRAPETGSTVTRGYVLQRYMQGIQSRGTYPVKFNGGYATVEPTAMGRAFNADWRNWGDCHWFQNVRHIYHPMLASGDAEMMEAFWKLYENARPLAESRSKLYHGTQGAYFPETMSVFGTYSGGDYGWDRTGLQPKDVQCPWWDDAWNQGPELIALMLDRYEYTQDRRFLQERVVPMAVSVLKYFDTRFKKDASGRIVLDPTQVVETYWEGVVNDLPTTAGLIAITDRLAKLPGLAAGDKAFFVRMQKACPELPLEVRDGKRQLAPAQKYAPKISNVENGELYAVWPFGVVSLAKPALMAEALTAYANRKNKLDKGWGYDGNVAAMLGMADEAARILQVKAANSNPAYRWPATWGPNFDWLPDQNHGGNLLNTTQLMLMQAEPLADGGKIRLLPAWPRDWDVDFKLHAPAKTTVQCVFKNGKVQSLTVEPKSRMKDVVMPAGL